MLSWEQETVRESYPWSCYRVRTGSGLARVFIILGQSSTRCSPTLNHNLFSYFIQMIRELYN